MINCWYSKVRVNELEEVNIKKRTFDHLDNVVITDDLDL